MMDEKERELLLAVLDAATWPLRSKPLDAAITALRAYWTAPVAPAPVEGRRLAKGWRAEPAEDAAECTHRVPRGGDIEYDCDQPAAHWNDDEDEGACELHAPSMGVFEPAPAEPAQPATFDPPVPFVHGEFCACPKCKAKSATPQGTVGGRDAATPSRPLGTLWLGPDGYVIVPMGGKPGFPVSNGCTVKRWRELVEPPFEPPIPAPPPVEAAPLMCRCGHERERHSEGEGVCYAMKRGVTCYCKTYKPIPAGGM